MYFEIVGPITDIETIAVGMAIRQRHRPHCQRRAAACRDPLVRGTWNRTRSPQDQEVSRL